MFAGLGAFEGLGFGVDSWACESLQDGECYGAPAKKK